MYKPCSEIKGADQLRSDCEADLHLSFCICKMLVFSGWGCKPAFGESLPALCAGTTSDLPCESLGCKPAFGESLPAICAGTTSDLPCESLGCKPAFGES